MPNIVLRHNFVAADATGRRPKKIDFVNIRGHWFSAPPLFVPAGPQVEIELPDWAHARVGPRPPASDGDLKHVWEELFGTDVVIADILLGLTNLLDGDENFIFPNLQAPTLDLAARKMDLLLDFFATARMPTDDPSLRRYEYLLEFLKNLERFYYSQNGRYYGNYP